MHKWPLLCGLLNFCFEHFNILSACSVKAARCPCHVSIACGALYEGLAVPRESVPGQRADVGPLWIHKTRCY